MKNASTLRFRPGVEPLEAREVPAFLAPITSPGGGDSVAVGDVNLDHRDDVAVLRGKNVVVSLSVGDGTFRTLTTLTGAKGPLVSAYIRDVNNDGKPDVMAIGSKPDGWTVGDPGAQGRVRTYTVYVNIWLGNGDGTSGPLNTTSISHSGRHTTHLLRNCT